MECKCGGTIERWEVLDSTLIGDEDFVTVSGYCNKCDKRYVWDEIYIFDRIENLEIADE